MRSNLSYRRYSVTYEETYAFNFEQPTLSVYQTFYGHSFVAALCTWFETASDDRTSLRNSCRKSVYTGTGRTLAKMLHNIQSCD